MTKSSLTNFHAPSSSTPHATVETQSTQAVVTAHATPVHGYAPPSLVLPDVLS